MLDLESSPSLRLLFRIARRRVAVGFVVAAVAFVLARPSWQSLSIGVPVALIGEAIRVWAAGHLMKGREVTTSGPYALTRHPLYAGSVMIGVGFVITAASAIVTVLVLVYLTVMIAVAIRLEEATLRAAFGETYARYVAGKAELTVRQFSLQRVRENQEHQALLGVAASVVILVLLAS